jgi:hypothetical protein
VRTTIFVLLAGALIAVAGGAAVARGVDTRATGPSAESPATAGLRGPCGRSFVEDSVHAFLAAVNHGDRSAIDAAVATGSRFRVYSQTQRYGNSDDGFFSSGDRSRVVNHLFKRQAKGDRYRARDLDPNGYDRAFEICNLGFVLKRRIGGGSWRPFVGKGALDHPSGAISVWNVGGQCGPHAPEPFPCPGR